jgi:hypothetical protein
LRVQKRRHEAGEEEEADEDASSSHKQSMDTPERLKRAAPKRARVVEACPKGHENKGNKLPTSDGEDVDVGLLLG